MLTLLWTWGLGCPKSSTFEIDPALPETGDSVQRLEPLSLLEQSAGSLDPAPRARALALLVENGDDPDHWGQRALLDPSDWVRRAGIEALGRRGDAPSRALLERAAADSEGDPYLRAMAAMAAPGPTASAAMADALTRERQSWRVAPLALAAVRLGDGSARPALEQALAQGELPLDLPFLREVGRSEERSLVTALARAQGRVEDELALPLASARLMLGDADAEATLRQAVTAPDEERQLEALDVLVDLDLPTALALVKRASEGPPGLVRWYAELALAAHGDGDTGVFERAYREPDREVRALAVEFAGRAAAGGTRRADKRAGQVVLAGLSDPDTTVRVTACRAASALRLGAAATAAQGLLTDEAEIVRIEASGALLSLR
ncbi:MAG: hypothetical protein ABMA64_12105 [Myxococcota bacterium]